MLDLSYYQGKLYLYFGVTPALVLFWPYVALTGHYLLHRDAVVIFFSVGFLASVGLLWAVWRRYFAEVGVWVVAAGALALGLANFTLAFLPRCDVYEVAISCGYALTMVTLTLSGRRCMPRGGGLGGWRGPVWPTGWRWERDRRCCLARSSCWCRWSWFGETGAEPGQRPQLWTAVAGGDRPDHAHWAGADALQLSAVR